MPNAASSSSSDPGQLWALCMPSPSLAMGGTSTRADCAAPTNTGRHRAGDPLVLVGMPDLLSVISASRQLSRRFDILASPPWKYDERGSNLLYHLEPMLLLKHYLTNREWIPLKKSDS